MIGIILYLIVAALVIVVGYKAYTTSDATDKDKLKYVILALLIIAFFWPIFVMVLILTYVIYRTKIWRNVKDLKDKLNSW